MLKKIRAKIAQWKQVRDAERRLKEFVDRLPPEKKIVAKDIEKDLSTASTPGAKVAMIRKKVDTLQGTTARVQSRIEVIRKEIGSPPPDNYTRVMSMPIQSTSHGYNSDTYCRTDSSSSSSESSSSSSSDSSSCSSSD